MRFSNLTCKLSCLALLGLMLHDPLIITEVNAAEVKLDSTAAVVNSGIILESELNAEQRRVEQISKARNINLDKVAARSQALENLITKAILLQMAEQQGYDLNDMQVDQALAQTAERNNASVAEILKSFGPSASEAQQRENFKNEFIINELRSSRVRSRIHVSQAEVDNLAKNLKDRGSVEPQYHIAQIIIPLSLNPSESEYRGSQNEARSLITKLRKGMSFNEALAKYPAEGNGDMGYLAESQIPLPFVPALVKSKPGDVIGPFRSPSGLHIFKVYDINHNAIAPIRTYDAAHILLKTSIIFSDEAAQAQLKQIRDDILNNKLSFAQAAKQYSQDPGSAIDGGNLGYSVPERYDPNFARGMVSLKKGQISEPIKSSFGWHLIYLKDIKIDNNSDEAFRDRARSIIYEREFAQAARSWERELRASAYIHVLDPELLNHGVNLNQEQR